MAWFQDWQTKRLYKAVRGGKLSAMKSALNAGADVDGGESVNRWVRDEDDLYLDWKGDLRTTADVTDQTPLWWAVAMGHSEIVKVLLKRGAGANLEAETPLHVAVRRGDLKAVQLLLSHGADPAAEYQRQTPVSLATELEHNDIAEALLLHGGPGTAWNISGNLMTPLHWAAETGRSAMVVTLLNKGADIEARDSLAGNTSLQLAAKYSQYSVAELLLDRGADLHTRNSFGMTPLHYAATAGSSDMAAVLLTRGAELRATDNCGLTAEDTARRSITDRHRRTAQMLAEYQARNPTVAGEGQRHETAAHEVSRANQESRRQLRWADVSEAAAEMFCIWVDQPELVWAKEAWEHVVAAGLADYVDGVERAVVSLRCMGLATLYYDWCAVAYDELHSDDRILEAADVLGVKLAPPNRLGGCSEDESGEDDELAFEWEEHADEVLSELLYNAHNEIVPTVMAGFGPSERFFASLCRSCSPPEDEDSDASDTCVDRSYWPEFMRDQELRAWSWVEQGCPRWR